MFLSLLRRKTPISMKITLYGEIMTLRETCIMSVFETVRYQYGKKKKRIYSASYGKTEQHYKTRVF